MHEVSVCGLFFLCERFVLDKVQSIETNREKIMEAIIVQKSPYAIEVKSGSSYYWCSCGKSANQPLCDGSHKDSTFVPVKFEAEDSKTVYFCGCKHSSTKPFCDGSHSKL